MIFPANEMMSLNT